MSQREGKDLKPYKLLPDGKFDLDQWNEDYWKRFQNFMQWTADPRHYQFADISQVNGRVYDDEHWKRLGDLLQLVNSHPRPSNHVKIYAGGFTSWGSGAPEDGIERFWRNILGGSASARFHRPGLGEGDALNDSRKGSLKAARILEERIKFWDITPHNELLHDRSPNEAYLAADPGKSYALYFTHGGSVGLDHTLGSLYSRRTLLKTALATATGTGMGLVPRLHVIGDDETRYSAAAQHGQR